MQMFLLLEERDLSTVDHTRRGEWANISWGNLTDVMCAIKSVGLKIINRKIYVFDIRKVPKWLAEITAHWKKDSVLFIIVDSKQKIIVVFYDISFLCFNICFLINPVKYIKYSVLQQDH